MTIRDTRSAQRRLFPFLAVVAFIAAGGAVVSYAHQHERLPHAVARTHDAPAAGGWSPA